MVKIYIPALHGMKSGGCTWQYTIWEVFDVFALSDCNRGQEAKTTVIPRVRSTLQEYSSDIVSFFSISSLK